MLFSIQTYAIEKMLFGLIFVEYNVSIILLYSSHPEIEAWQYKEHDIFEILIDMIPLELICAGSLYNHVSPEGITSFLCCPFTRYWVANKILESIKFLTKNVDLKGSLLAWSYDEPPRRRIIDDGTDEGSYAWDGSEGIGYIRRPHRHNQFDGHSWYLNDATCVHQLVHRIAKEVNKSDTNCTDNSDTCGFRKCRCYQCNFYPIWYSPLDVSTSNSCPDLMYILS